jgi:hypothetical protein
MTGGSSVRLPERLQRHGDEVLAERDDLVTVVKHNSELEALASKVLRSDKTVALDPRTWAVSPLSTRNCFGARVTRVVRLVVQAGTSTTRKTARSKQR